MPKSIFFLLKKLLNKATGNTKTNFYSKLKLLAKCEIDNSALFSSKSIWCKNGNSLNIGAETQIDGRIYFDRDNSSIQIGKRCFINGSIISAEQITIGDDVLISWGTTIVDHDSHSISYSFRDQDVVKWRKGLKDWSKVPIAPIKIDDKVWIGFNSIVLKGIHVGEGAVIGAGSVVTKDVLPWHIVAGNPARIIREISENER